MRYILFSSCYIFGWNYELMYIVCFNKKKKRMNQKKKKKQRNEILFDELVLGKIAKSPK